MTGILCAIFFASGASALVFETLWFHQAGLAFGNSVWASSLVLSGFMGGLALGNALSARFGDRLGDPVRAYARFEVAIAVSGVLLVYGFPHLGVALAGWLGVLAERPWLLNALRLAFAFTLLLVPSTAMGATLPLLTKALVASRRDFGQVLGRLYGWNTLGAVAGVVGAEAFLVGALGVRGSALAAGGANLAAAAVAFGVSRRIGTQGRPARAPERLVLGAGRRWLVAVFGTGFALLALEVVWFRFLALYVSGNSLSLALMLGTVLSGIGLGGFTAAAWLRRDPEAHRAIPAVALAAGTLCVACYAGFAPVAAPVGSGLVESPLRILWIGLPLMLPVSLLSGVFFTLCGAALREELPSEISTAGALTFANTTGAALGSLAGGFVLLPALGMERCFFVLALLYGAVGIVARPRLALLPRRITAMAAAALLAVLALFPFGAMRDRHLSATIARWTRGGTAEVALLREGLTQTLLYLDRRELGAHHSFRLLTNGYSMSGTDNRARRYMKLYAYWPIAVHPAPRSALLISFGVGATAQALVDTRALERIDVVDISREILDASRVVHPDSERHPLGDPRVRVHVEDGRYFLQTTKRRFDLITGEPPPPREAGVVNLYTREYFALIRDRLSEGGITTYWLPIHALTENSAKSILRAFCEVFDDCSLWNGNGNDLMMVGTRGARGPVSSAHFAAQWSDPGVAPELHALGFERPEQLGALFIGGAEYLRELTRDARPLEDDHPKRVMAAGEYPERLPAEYLAWRDVRAAAARFRTDPLVERLWPEAMRAASAAYFPHQGSINRAAYARSTDLDDSIESLHALLTGTDLQIPVLWALGSDTDLQRVVRQTGSAERGRPGVRFHLGVRRLSERSYAAAAENFERAEAHPEYGRDAFRLRVYALCLDGRRSEAERLARERHTEAAGGQPLPPFWIWLGETFDVRADGTTRLAAKPPRS